MNKKQQKELIKANGLSNLQRLGYSNIAILIIGTMEHWFRQYPNGFYRHGKPCADQANLHGFAWEIELGISKTTFKKYFEEVGYKHNSPKEFSLAKWKYPSRFYCSVLEESNNHRTIYYRNHKLARIIEGVLAIDYPKAVLSVENAEEANELNMGLGQ